MARPIDAYTLNNDLVSWYNDTEDEKEKSILRRVMQRVVQAPTITPPNELLTLEQLRQMDGEPVWIAEIKHWALIDIKKGGQWDGIPFAFWAENGAKFSYIIKDRNLHCYRRPPEGEEHCYG